MRMLEPNAKSEIHVLQLYLTQREAEQVKSELERLLRDPEANDHFHILSEDGRRDLSCSIVTSSKLAAGGYTQLERKLLAD